MDNTSGSLQVTGRDRPGYKQIRCAAVTTCLVLILGAIDGAVIWFSVKPSDEKQGQTDPNTKALTSSFVPTSSVVPTNHPTITDFPSILPSDQLYLFPSSSLVPTLDCGAKMSSEAHKIDLQLDSTTGASDNSVNNTPVMALDGNNILVVMGNLLLFYVRNQEDGSWISNNTIVESEEYKDLVPRSVAMSGTTAFVGYPSPGDDDSGVVFVYEDNQEDIYKQSSRLFEDDIWGKVVLEDQHDEYDDDDYDAIGPFIHDVDVRCTHNNFGWALGIDGDLAFVQGHHSLHGCNDDDDDDDDDDDGSRMLSQDDSTGTVIYMFRRIANNWMQFDTIENVVGIAARGESNYLVGGTMVVVKSTSDDSSILEKKFLRSHGRGEVQLEDEHQNMDSHNNENEVEGGGKAFVVVNMEDNERRYISLLATMVMVVTTGQIRILLAIPRPP